MKKIVASMILAWGITSLFAQPLNPAVAIVKLHKTMVITTNDFREKVARHEKDTGAMLSQEDKNKFLDTLIAEELLSQEAEKQGIHVSEEEVLRQLSRYANPASDPSRLKTDIEKQMGLSWEKAVIQLKRQFVLQRFFFTHPKAKFLQNLDIPEKEVMDFFDENKSKFVAPDMVRVSQIFFDTKINPKGTEAEIKKRAEEIRKQISLGQATFEEMVRKESDDKVSSTANGDLGFLPRDFSSPNGKRLIQLFGRDFLNTLFSLNIGELSQVLSSNSGFHIIRITDFIPQHFMKLDDETYPGSGVKVRDIIKQNLMQVRQEAVLSEIRDELKKVADIKIFRQNM